ncbi:IclR family transcriptional regulator [Streptomyces olivaceus]|uniref:IclR family transcriptional regulator n=1 Tax=Streptomyces olivaceus TaxID=47716 RepID=UPI001CCBEF1D|nr:IclR family transcriptional regulator [Streptomyces olivaceus]MBZ6083661.1 IclR family transcriptional regulator [Streptomyces olivaceus]
MSATLPHVTNKQSLDCDSQPASVLSKAHLLLSAFSHGITTLGLTELSRRSGVSKGSAHRLAMELVELGYLARTPKGYQLGWGMFQLGQLVPGPARLRDVARPAMQDLRMASHAVVHLAVPQGAECVYLERIAGRRELIIIDAVADRVPHYTTASGRIFLAHADPQVIACLDSVALAAMGARDHDELAAKFEDIRTQRHAEECSTCLRGVKSIAVPVTYPGADHVIAAVSVTVPVERKDDQHLLHALWATSTDITRGLLRQMSAGRTHFGRQLAG